MKKEQQIKVVEYVHTAEGVKPVEALGAEQREKFRRWLLCTWLNGLYLGKAVAYYPEGTEASSSVACGDSFPSRGRFEDGGTEVASNARRYGPEGETVSSASLGMTGDGGTDSSAPLGMTRGTRAAEVHGPCGGGDGNG